MAKLMCNKCGLIFTDSKPPKECPFCKSQAAGYIKIKEDFLSTEEFIYTNSSDISILYSEIKNIKGKRYCGYRYKKQYYESFGNFIIPDPFKWRFIKDEGFMAEWIRNKLYELKVLIRKESDKEYSVKYQAITERIDDLLSNKFNGCKNCKHIEIVEKKGKVKALRENLNK